jgi:hypothetical protein
VHSVCWMPCSVGWVVLRSDVSSPLDDTDPSRIRFSPSLLIPSVSQGVERLVDGDSVVLPNGFAIISAVHGHLNTTLKEELGDLLPDFTDEEWKVVKGSSDL